MFLTFLISVPLVANWLDQAERHFFGVKPGVTIAGENLGGLLADEVRLAVEELAVREQVLPLEPRLDKQTGTIIPGRNGRILDIENTVSRILSATESQRLKPEMITIYPRYTAADLQKIKRVLGYCETGVSGTYQRHSNISLASSAVNNTVVWPGEVFSFNETVGPRTPERGYLPAPVILMGGGGMDFGGGVCQVSSTIYNAALSSGLRIVERHPHSRPVRYVPAGRDATVNYGYLDLKVLNNRPEPVIIKCGLSRGRVWASVYGGGE